MSRQPGRVMVVLAAALAFVLGFAIPAAATIDYSDRWTLRTTSGITFTNQARVENEGNTSSSETTTYASSTAPTGWMGSEPRLLYSNGALCETGGMSYSGSSLNFLRRTLLYGGSADIGQCGDGYFYAKGKSAVWHGSGYSYYYTHRTINVYMID